MNSIRLAVAAAIALGSSVAVLPAISTAIAPVAPSVAFPDTVVVDVAGGDDMSCVVLSDGTAFCSGQNGEGELGNGVEGPDEPSPTQVLGIDDAIEVESWDEFSCVRSAIGQVSCWGDNASGQTGNGTTTGDDPFPGPVVDLPLADAVTTGNETGCALVSGAVWCWGDNSDGQLVDGTTDDRGSAAQIPGLSGVTAITAGDDHVCALMSDTTVQCWGDNEDGQLGRGSATSTDETPATATGFGSGVTAIDAGNDFTCAVVGGTTRCVGDGENGVLGNGSESDALVPTDVQGLPSGATAISANEDHVCAIVGGGAWCWGENSQGELGRGTATRFEATAAPVVGLPGQVVEISPGDSHTCARTSDGVGWCWGQADDGETGTGELLESATPVPVIGLPDSAGTLELGGRHSCWVTDAGPVWCWGDPASLQFIDDEAELPIESSTPQQVTLLPDADQLATDNHGCAIVEGAVRCWGLNNLGEVGDGTETPRAAPVGVTGLDSGVTQVVVGGGHSCALRSGDVSCWGRHRDGDLGDGSPIVFGADSDTPVPVVESWGTEVVEKIATDNHTTCALADGGVWCWGAGTAGQLGNGSNSDSNVPVTVTSLGFDVDDIAVGDSHACAALIDGTVQCWGRGSSGQLGDGTENSSTTPVDVSGLTGVTDIYAAADRTCALAGGDLWCWGRNDRGQLGAGSLLEESTVPIRVVGLTSTPTSVDLGQRHSCAATPTDGVVCWGDNSSGELGEGSAVVQLLPVAWNSLPVRPDVARVAGATRIETAIAASQNSYGTDEAGAVVLARADLYPDALVGGPLASVLDGPLLLTSSDQLSGGVLAEIDRVLPAGGDVHVLGGTAAISSAVTGAVTAAGYTVIRYAGSNRYDTAGDVADAIDTLGGDTDTVLLALGTNFPDALAASAAGAQHEHPVLLTRDDTPDAITDAWLAANTPSSEVCVGGPACRAYPGSDIELRGVDRYATAVAVADEFFEEGSHTAVASGVVFPDALVAAADTPNRGGPLVLTRPDLLPIATSIFLDRWNPREITIFGGTAAISQDVEDQLG